MNLIDYLSTLEDIVLDGQLPILKNKSVINVEEVLSMIDEMKKILPSEIREASHAITEKNQLIIEAHKEADEMLAAVPAEVEKRINEHDITALAKERKEEIIGKADEEAKTIIASAESESEEIRKGTLEYLSDKIDELSVKILTVNSELQASKKELEVYFGEEKKENN